LKRRTKGGQRDNPGGVPPKRKSVKRAQLGKRPTKRGTTREIAKENANLGLLPPQEKKKMLFPFFRGEKRPGKGPPFLQRFGGISFPWNQSPGPRGGKSGSNTGSKHSQAPQSAS